jgi:hypothetical protein
MALHGHVGIAAAKGGLRPLGVFRHCNFKRTRISLVLIRYYYGELQAFPSRLLQCAERHDGTPPA